MAEEVVLTCTYCGDEYTRHPSNAMKSRFCSSSCEQHHKRDHPEEYYRERRSEVYEIRESIFERDGHECVQCGREQTDSRRDLDMHHAIPSKFFKDYLESYFDDNLVTLCSTCHSGWDRVTRQMGRGEEISHPKYVEPVLEWFSNHSPFEGVDDSQLEKEVERLREKVDDQ